MRTWQDWEQIHQPFELNYHATQGIAWCSDEKRFQDFWGQIFDFVGIGEKDEDGDCLDVGSGPRPPLEEGSTAIDPLAFKYKALAPDWWKGITAYNQPAETMIKPLAERFNTVLCWNCLDHTIGWKDILANLKSYGAKTCIYAIATDFNPPHQGHPGFEREDFFAEIEKHFEVTKYAEDFQERDVALVLR